MSAESNYSRYVANDCKAVLMLGLILSIWLSIYQMMEEVLNPSRRRVSARMDVRRL
jgi:hypothetical protein